MSLVRHAMSPYWYMSFTVNGKPVFKSTKTNNKAQALRIEAEARKQMIETMHFDVKDEVTLGDLIKVYVESRETEGKHTSDGCYSRKLLGGKFSKSKKSELIPIFGFKPTMWFHDIKTRDLFNLLTARKSEGNLATTILQELLFINGLMKTAKQLGYRLPDIDIEAFKRDNKIKAIKKPIRYLSPDEEKRLLTELDPRVPHAGLALPENQSPETRRLRWDAYDFVVVLLDVGSRCGELSSITWEQIDLEKKIIRLVRSKVNNESFLYMTDRMYEVFKRRSENKDSEVYVFTSKDGSQRNYAPTALRSACRRAGIENCTYHTLRKTLATKLVQGGLAISDVSAILGHTNVATTQNYYASVLPSESSKRALQLLNV